MINFSPPVASKLRHTEYTLHVWNKSQPPMDTLAAADDFREGRRMGMRFTPGEGRVSKGGVGHGGYCRGGGGGEGTKRGVGTQRGNQEGENIRHPLLSRRVRMGRWGR